MSNLFNLPDLPAQAPPPPVPEPPLTREQSEMFEEWERLGLASLFEPLTLKEGDSNVNAAK